MPLGNWACCSAAAVATVYAARAALVCRLRGEQDKLRRLVAGGRSMLRVTVPDAARGGEGVKPDTNLERLGFGWDDRPTNSITPLPLGLRHGADLPGDAGASGATRIPGAAPRPPMTAVGDSRAADAGTVACGAPPSQAMPAVPRRKRLPGAGSSPRGRGYRVGWGGRPPNPTLQGWCLL